MGSVIGFLRHYLRPDADAVEVVEIQYRRGTQTLPATLYRPAGQRAPLPAWIVLHGLTWHGRHHASLQQFVRAIAASGFVVLVPEVPEWSRLDVAPAVTGPSIAAAIDALQEHARVYPDRIGVLGFSFGATQALVAAVDPALHGRVRAVVAWGGYRDLHNLFHFGFTGEHELDGQRHYLPPDPYGGWVMGANYLTRIPGHAGHQDVATALRSLAEESGRRGLHAWDPSYDSLKQRLRDGLPPAQRELFDVFAPRTGATDVPYDRAVEITRALADAALETDSLLDPGPFLDHLTTRVLIAHGRDDRLVPFTEAIRMSRALPSHVCHSCTITQLFAHSGGAARDLGPIGLGREGIRFFTLLRDMLHLV